MTRTIPQSTSGAHDPDDTFAENFQRSFRLQDFSKMVRIPAGEFVMGETAGDKFANDTERPAHIVRIGSAFALSQFPVTVGHYRKFREEHAPEDAEDWPVVNVTWHEAMAYCDWLSDGCGRTFRLPSEAEWEYACRAGSQQPFATGSELSVEEANYLYDENGGRVGRGQRTPPGTFPANGFGLHDMHGNVCEWTADAWHPDYLNAPADGSVWDAADDRRVIRGGAWDYLPRLLRSSWRDWRFKTQHADNLGFRIATSDVEGI